MSKINTILLVTILGVISLVGVRFIPEQLEGKVVPPIKIETSVVLEDAIVAPGDTLVLQGVAINNKATLNGSTVDIRYAYKTYLQNETPIPLLINHGRDLKDKVGVIKDLVLFEDQGVIMFVAEFYVDEDNIKIAKKLMSGFYDSVSIGIAPHLTKMMDGKTFIVRGEIIEISLVALPACKAAKISNVYKK